MLASLRGSGPLRLAILLAVGSPEVVVLAVGTPVANASVLLGDVGPLSDSGSPTDPAGSLTIPRLTPEGYVVQVEKDGFAPASVYVQVRPGAVTAVEIDLKPLQ